MNEDGKSQSESSSTPTSKNSAPPSSGSKRAWKRPSNVREFAAQTNMICTMFLNGEVDFNMATGYARLARTYAQLMGIEATKARLAKSALTLEMPDYEFIEEDEVI